MQQQPATDLLSGLTWMSAQDAVPKLGSPRGAQAPVGHVAPRPDGGHHVHGDVHLSRQGDPISRDLHRGSGRSGKVC